MPIAFPKRFRPIANIPLRWVLVIPFVAQTVGAVALVGYLSYRSGQQAVTNVSQRLMDEVSDRTTLYLQETLALPHLINDLNADAIRLGHIPSFESQNTAALEKFFWVQLLRFPSVSTIAIANERGGMVGSGWSDRSPVIAVYRTPQFTKGTYSISALDAQGNVTQSAIVAENYDARTRPWYQTPAQRGRAVWSSIYQFVSREPSLAISAGLPIYDASDQLRGVLATDITLDRLNRFLAELRISQSGQVFIIERSGLLVASSTRQPVLQAKGSALERTQAIDSQEPVMRETMAQLIDRFDSLNEIQTTQQLNIAIESEQGRSPQFVRVTPFRDQYGLDWLIVLVVPESDFMAEMQANKAQIIALCCLTLAAMMGVGVLTASWITKPILKLKRASQALAEGTWQEPLSESSSIAELQSLTRSFNQTADQLRQSFDRIKLALAESEEKFTTIFRASPDPIALTTLTEGRILEANNRFGILYGYSREEILGHTVVELEFWHNLEDRKSFIEPLHQDGRIYNLEATICTRDKHIKTVLMSAEVCDIQGQKCVITLIRDISDRKRVEDQLRKSEADLKQAQKIARCGNWDYDIATGQVYWSDEMYRIHGVDPGQPILVGEDATTYIYPDDHDKYRREILQKAIAGEPFASDMRILRPDGSIRYVNSRGEAVFDERNQMIGLRGVVQDVTDRKQLERALQASEAKTKSILNSAIAAIASMRVFPKGDWQIDHVSAGCEVISGYTPQELTDANLWVSLIHAEERETIIGQVLLDICAERTGTYEYRLHHKNGSLRWVSQTNNSFWNEAQQCWDVTVISVDITDRKLIEIALRDNEARLKEAQRVAQVGSWELDVATRRGLWSSELFRIVGLDPAQPEPSFDELVEMIVEEDRILLVTAVERAIANGIPYEVEHRIRRPDNSIRYLVSRGQVVFNKQQQVVRLYGTALDITDRKLAEIALRESETRFQKLAAASPAAIYTIIEDVNGIIRFEYISSAAEEIHEIPIADLRQNGTLISYQMHPDDRAAYREAVIRSIETLQPFRHEWRIITPSGKVKWLQAHSRHEQRETGEIVWHGIVLDVTDRKQTEAALQESETRFRLAIENAPDVFVIYDCDRRLQYVNQKTIERTGIPLDTYLGQRDEDVYPPEIYSQYLPILLKTVETRTFQSGEVNLYLPGQDQYSFFVKYVPVLDEQGDIQQIFGITFDITELKQTEMALRHSEARFRHIAATAPGMLYDYQMFPDGSGHYLYVSPRCSDVLELDPEALLQNMQLFWELVHPDDLQALQMISLEASTNHSLFFAEFRFFTPSGKLKWLQVASLPGEQLQPSGAMIWSGFLLDVTDRKQMEQELRSAKETAELANRAKSAFLANMSHELRTPLNSVLGFTQLMQRDTTLPPDSQEYVNLIHKSGSHLLNLINEILDLSKIEAGRLTLEQQTIDLFELLQLIHSTFMQRATKKGLHLHLEIASGVPQFIITDSQKLQQILINLTSNAIKFTQQGSVHLLVSLFSSPACLQFQVNDTGVGIAPQDLDLIFDAFAQASAGRQSQEGTGLGLTISRKLVQFMGGEISVSSTLGQGSTFQFTIPIQFAAEGVSSAETDRQITGLTPNQPDWRILIVDDQTENRLLLLKLLETVGITVREASNGEEAIALWQHWQPHLIWLDIRMPGINGYEVTQHIRTAEQSHNVKKPTIIIALTAQASTDDRFLAFAAGCDDYLSKPFQAQMLFSKMAEHLGIRYAYADDRSPCLDAEAAIQPLTIHQLAVMPQEWIAALYQTSMTCEQKAVKQLIHQIPPEHAALAIAIDQLIEDFDFEEIMQLAQACLRREGE